MPKPPPTIQPKISQVVQGVTYTNVPACPLCGGKISVVEATTVEPVHPGYHVKGTDLPTRERAVVVAACSGCEFVTEIR